MGKRYIGKWFDVDVEGVIVRAKCIDVEFEGGFGPVLLMENRWGSTLWVPRKEILET